MLLLSNIYLSLHFIALSAYSTEIKREMKISALEPVKEKKMNFRKIRKELGMTQEQVAGILGLTNKSGKFYVGKLESGKATPSGTLIKCLEYYLELQTLEYYLK
jgi:DNA-binding XRE family transcriptional regulator